jgi:hypothetical protein
MNLKIEESQSEMDSEVHLSTEMPLLRLMNANGAPFAVSRPPYTLQVFVGGRDNLPTTQ